MSLMFGDVNLQEQLMKVQRFRKEATSALSLPPSPSRPARLEELVRRERSLDISVPEKDKLKKVSH